MKKRIALLALAAALNGCGGGGGEEPHPQAATPQAPATSPPITSEEPPSTPVTESAPTPSPAPSEPAAPAAKDRVQVVMDAIREQAATATAPQPATNPPTITPGVNGALTRIAGSTLVAWNSGKFLYTAPANQAGTNYPDYMFASFGAVSYSPTARQANHVEIEFTTDAPAFEVLSKGVGISSAMRFVIDGDLASEAAVEYPVDGGVYLTKVDFGSSALRRVRILCNAQIFGGVRVTAESTVSAPPAPVFRAMFLGDSFTEGTASVAGTTYSFAPLTAQLLGWRDAWISGVGATGYLAGPDPKLNFRERFDRDVKAYAPDVLVIAGGINDGGFTDAQIQVEAGLLFDRIQTDLPNTIVFVLGPWNPRSAIRPGINAALQAAAAGRSNFFWVRNYDDAWITGTGYVGHERGDGNSDVVISADSTHPTGYGHFYLAQKLADTIKAVEARP